MASLLIRSLSEEGYVVSLAPDGNTGLDMALHSHYSLMILDIMLPGVNGMEICRKVREAGITKPILMLTALGTTQNIVTAVSYTHLDVYKRQYHA